MRGRPLPPSDRSVIGCKPTSSEQKAQPSHQLQHRFLSTLVNNTRLHTLWACCQVTSDFLIEPVEYKATARVSLQLQCKVTVSILAVHTQLRNTITAINAHVHLDAELGMAHFGDGHCHLSVRKSNNMFAKTCASARCNQ